MKTLLIPLCVAMVSCQPPKEAEPAADAADANAPARPKPSADDPDSFLGLTEAEAIQAAAELEILHRVLERDGETFPATMDYRENRFNFAIRDNRVIRVTRG